MKVFGNCLQPKWSTGLCDCGNNLGIFCITCCLPCITFGQIAEAVDDGKSSCCAQGCVYCLLMTVQCHWLYSCIYRGKLRSKYDLPDDPCCDCGVHFFCEPCALCQERAELKQRGFDSKGWVGSPKAPPPWPLSMFK